jgi:hypothetical protein
VEQQVVERRVDIGRRAFEDGGDGPLAEAGAVAFVVPEGLGVEVVEAQAGGEEEEDGGEQKVARGGWRVAGEEPSP